MNFNFRIGDLELRSCDEHLMDDDRHTIAEIVYWNSDNTCYTVAYYIVSDGASSLKFVGKRPFDDRIDIPTFMGLAKLGNGIIDGWYEANHTACMGYY